MDVGSVEKGWRLPPGRDRIVGNDEEKRTTFLGTKFKADVEDTVRDGTSLDRAPTDAQTFDHKRHEAAYETPQPSIREAAQEKAPDTGRNALTPGL